MRKQNLAKRPYIKSLQQISFHYFGVINGSHLQGTQSLTLAVARKRQLKELSKTVFATVGIFLHLKHLNLQEQYNKNKANVTRAIVY